MKKFPVVISTRTLARMERREIGSSTIFLEELALDRQADERRRALEQRNDELLAFQEQMEIDRRDVWEERCTG